MTKKQVQVLRRPEQPKMTYAQQQFLLKELRGASFYRVNVPKLPKPRKVLTAEKAAARAQRVVTAHANAQRRLNDRMRKRYDDLLEAARRVVYFGTPEQALAAVDKLQKFCGAGK